MKKRLLQTFVFLLIVGALGYVFYMIGDWILKPDPNLGREVTAVLLGAVTTVMATAVIVTIFSFIHWLIIGELPKFLR